MTISVHNPDQYMASLRQIIGQGRKRIGLLLGAGVPAGMSSPSGTGSLIPAVAGLTSCVLDALDSKYGGALSAVKADLKDPNIENILSRVRSLAGVIGTTPIHGLDGPGHKALSEAICSEIGKVVNQSLPAAPTPYSDFVNWISGAERENAVEVFTTNYPFSIRLRLRMTTFRRDGSDYGNFTVRSVGRATRKGRSFVLVVQPPRI
jgi:hypothetical protein